MPSATTDECGRAGAAPRPFFLSPASRSTSSSACKAAESPTRGDERHLVSLLEVSDGLTGVLAKLAAPQLELQQHFVDAQQHGLAYGVSLPDAAANRC